jgi:DNA-binding transcriptional regulator YdaS (Cro superfamily)
MNALKAYLEGERGRAKKLAEALKVSQTNISNWVSRGVSYHRVLDVEKHTGIPRHDLRPDIFGEAA